MHIVAAAIDVWVRMQMQVQV
eukprot:SAG11_NODE_36966_length_259_cov_0.643750_1_plen_20_part_10